MAAGAAAGQAEPGTVTPAPAAVNGDQGAPSQEAASDGVAPAPDGAEGEPAKEPGEGDEVAAATAVSAAEPGEAAGEPGEAAGAPEEAADAPTVASEPAAGEPAAEQPPGEAPEAAEPETDRPGAERPAEADERAPVEEPGLAPDRAPVEEPVTALAPVVGATAATDAPAPEPRTPQPVTADAGRRGGPAPATLGERAAATPVRARPATAAALRASNPSATVPPRRPRAAVPPPVPGPRRRRSGPLVLLAALAVLLIGGGVFALTTLGGDEQPREPNLANVPESATPTADAGAQPDRAARGETTVAVLNGTNTTGLAASLVDELTQAGFAEGPRGNNVGAERATSVVMFTENFESQARDVARVLDISDVQPIDAATQSQPIGDAEVVVIAGHDQAP
jgi:hypothetical protein